MSANTSQKSGESGARIDQRSVAAWMRLMRVFQTIDRRSAEAFRQDGLTVAQFDVLAQVGVREGCTQQQLAEKLLVTKGNVCQVLDRMEDHGWIERRPVPTGRANQLFLTEQGRAIREQAVPAQEERITRIFEVLSDEERAGLALALRKLERSLIDDSHSHEGAN